ncbi:helix-turn-helix transcriptional regulator [Flavimaricola marinus]|uniref:Prophage CP4-57 regulatory protein (AlpA) n=1 Tax=Flavimaricola marinus TaxID=1819565 RepID=A0A238LGI0_9RHOB|nr:AlpA family phage regulatory protein [Flavimaricola marinus]SMY08066.1 Prophage CP4-57 regulatory protein (AlpA) [Flavimaricola marinus]
MKIEDGRKTLATREDLKRMGINVSRTTLLRWELNGRFPRRIRMGGTSVAWFMSEIQDWLADRADERTRTHYAEY